MLDSIKRQDGFTLPELVMSISLIGIISVSILAIFINYFVIITRNSIVAEMTADSQNLLRSTVEELRYGAGVRQSNTITDPNSPPTGWNTGNANFVIIVAVPASDNQREYIIDSATGNPYNNELVYFKQDSDLYKRTLANPSAAGNSLTTSCPAASATNVCPADKKLLENVSDMDFSLYDQDNALTTDPLLARSINVSLSMSKDSFGEPLTLTNGIRVTLRNTF